MPAPIIPRTMGQSFYHLLEHTFWEMYSLFSGQHHGKSSDLNTGVGINNCFLLFVPIFKFKFPSRSITIGSNWVRIQSQIFLFAV